MRHALVVVVLLLLGLGFSNLERDVELRVCGGLGEMAESVIEARGLEIRSDKFVTVIGTQDRDELLQALCQILGNYQKERDIIGNNIANHQTTKTADGCPYRRQYPVYSDEGELTGVAEDSSDFNWVYDPSHPDCMRDGPKAGYVPKPNINLKVEDANLARLAQRESLIHKLIEKIDPDMIVPVRILPTGSSIPPRKPAELMNGPAEVAPNLALSKLRNICQINMSTVSFGIYRPIKQSNNVSCGQTSVAVALNRLIGSNLNDKDIDSHYGFELLKALSSESKPAGYDWRDAGNVAEETRELIDRTLTQENLPVIIAYRNASDGRDKIVTLTDSENGVLTYADPETGTFQTMTWEELLQFDQHTDGSFIFLPFESPCEPGLLLLAPDGLL